MLIKKSSHRKNLNNSFKKKKKSGQGAGLVAYKTEDWIVPGVKT